MNAIKCHQCFLQTPKRWSALQNQLCDRKQDFEGNIETVLFADLISALADTLKHLKYDEGLGYKTEKCLLSSNYTIMVLCIMLFPSLI